MKLQPDSMQAHTSVASMVDVEKTEDNAFAVVATSTTDPDVVDWDPNDPENPYNWPAYKKWRNVAYISGVTILTPFSSTMFAPGVRIAMAEFNSDSKILSEFVVSIFVLGYVLGPLFMAPLSELYGRRWLYHCNTVLFALTSFACGKSTSLGMLIAFRFLSGLAGSCPVTIGSGTIADLFKQEERGKAMSLWTFPILFGPAIGPLVGSYLTEAAGWRWNFYLISILAALQVTVTLPLQEETYHPTLLEQKTRRLQKETGNPNLHSALRQTKPPRQVFLQSILRPTKLILFSPIVFLLSIYAAITYGYLYLLFTTMSPLFMKQYGISAQNVGLCYLGVGVGQFVAITVFNLFSDSLLMKLAKGGELKPEYRLPLVWPGAIAMPCGVLIYGWTINYRVHWIVPVIGTAVMGYGMIGSFLPIGTYLVDAFTTYAASAMAANTVLRSLCGAFLPLCGEHLLESLGPGWGMSLLAFISMSMFPAIWALIRYGEWIRTHPRFQVDL